ncbi:hypothetical protein FOL47_000801 [Perkinsus chesapeaki]|uniref:Fatty acid hydroxylase domain-containing protein n=1 Tax=Perkinsus chesapeaki TaxID=330153 RepID=A0A7J6KWA5_PERCH|nr:hypothetical protein FOL47_000801 [Perkinsus chesapeaki]
MTTSPAKPSSGWHLPRWEVAVCVAGVVLSFWIAEYLADEKAIDIGKRKMTYYNYIEGAIPLYLTLISLELAVLFLHRRRLSPNEVDWIPESGYHEVADSWSSIAAGSMDIVFTVMFIERFPLKTYVYEYLYQNYAVTELELSWAPHWVRLIIFGALIELCYYWFHRVSHENGLLWAMGHANHHSSEHYNFSTALRQGYLQQAVSWIFYLPLAVLGVPTDLSMTYRSWNIMYQFWVHSSIIGFLPWPLDEVFMTPSNHRIHHDRRFHKNFGGTLVVYDRLFGTYLREPTPTACVYGWTIPAKSWADSVLQLNAFTRQSRSLWKGPGYALSLLRSGYM